jgi:hypothetical protein
MILSLYFKYSDSSQLKSHSDVVGWEWVKLSLLAIFGPENAKKGKEHGSFPYRIKI